jgi:hypothetical protein
MIAVAAAVLAGLLFEGARAGESFTDEQLKARFYYDLGPAEADVSTYPKEQQENYGVFARSCSQCHTLARPLNSPIVSRKDWKRYVLRMHLRTKVAPGTAFRKEDAQAVVDFLTYDSVARKVQGKAAFDAQTASLKNLFGRVQKERSRRQIEDDEKKANPGGVPNGGQPRPQGG